jgi:hypothetical protein
MTEWSCILYSTLVLYIHKINATQEITPPKKGHGTTSLRDPISRVLFYGPFLYDDPF